MTSATSSPTGGNLETLLAVDTSAAEGSLALATLDGQILGRRSWAKKAMHSEVATLELESLLKEANLDLSQISRYAVNIGPGSFTGLRVGISLVRTLAYSFDRPVAAFSSLEILAHLHALEGETILVATRAVQLYLYGAVYRKTAGKIEVVIEPRSMESSEATLLVEKYRAKVLIEGTSAGFTPRTQAEDLVGLIKSATFFSWKELMPLYVRASEAEEKLKKGLLKPV